MRPSKLKTPLAVLRKKINTPRYRLPQKTVADWLKISSSHYRKLECGHARLNWKHADVISRKTGVNQWSLIGKTEGLKTNYGTTWTTADYEIARSRPKRAEREAMQGTLAILVSRVMAILLCARNKGEWEYYHYAWKTKALLTDILGDVTDTPANKSVVNPTGTSGGLLKCRHTANRLDLKPLVDSWHEFQKRLIAVKKL